MLKDWRLERDRREMAGQYDGWAKSPGSIRPETENALLRLSIEPASELSRKEVSDRSDYLWLYPPRKAYTGDHWTKLDIAIVALVVFFLIYLAAHVTRAWG